MSEVSKHEPEATKPVSDNSVKYEDCKRHPPSKRVFGVGRPVTRYGGKRKTKDNNTDTRAHQQPLAEPSNVDNCRSITDVNKTNNDNTPAAIAMDDNVTDTEIGYKDIEALLNTGADSSVQDDNTALEELYVGQFANIWTCETCNKQFAARHNLIVHQRTHTGEKPHQCKRCQRSFAVLSNLQRHVRNQHHDFLPYPCDMCDDGFYSQLALDKHRLLDHKVEKVKAEFDCRDCGKSFDAKRKLDDHMVMHTGARPFVCMSCGRTFSFRTNLVRHMKLHTGKKAHKCAECGQAFIERKSLINHLWRKHGMGSEERAQQSFLCEICNKSFSSRSNLYSHNFVHNGIKKFACDVCGKRFSIASNMRRHAQTHLGLKPFKCDTCAACFTEKKSLRVHQRRHTGEKPYKCQLCDKAFAQAGTLQAHMPVHDSMQRDYNCLLCAKSFLRKSHLTFHMKTHTSLPKFACQHAHCGKSFYRKGDLERHKVKHDRVKPFACTVCEKRFTRLQYLRDHSRIHEEADTSPYKCTTCALTFANITSFYEHNKTHDSLPDGTAENLRKITVDDDKSLLDVVTAIDDTALLKVDSLCQDGSGNLYFTNSTAATGSIADTTWTTAQQFILVMQPQLLG